MKKYRVTASYTVYCHAIVEAENKDEAYEMAIGLDGGDFDIDNDSPYGDWNINDVNEMGE
jgi:hypothetical protein